MPALLNSKIPSSPLQSVSVKWITSETTRQALLDDLLTRTEFSETWPFMEWIEEAAADQATKILGAYNSGIEQWAGFITFRSEFSIKPAKPGQATLTAEISVDSLYITEQERGKGMATTMMQIAVDSINASIQAVRAQNLLLKLDLHINFTADCFSHEAQKIALDGLTRLCSLQTEKIEVANRITLFSDDE
jgi:hypothetical protein